MKALLIGLLLSSVGAVAQEAIPAGTVLPLQLNSSLTTAKSKPGQTITARVMQDIPLSQGKKIRAGAKVIGRVVSVESAKNGGPAEIQFVFKQVKYSNHSVPVIAHIRALASMTDVEAVEIPPGGTDRGTPWAWSTRTLIGGEVAYGQGGPVSRGVETVGEAVFGGVLAPVSANLASGCDGEVADSAQPQALWLFSSNACGVYGIPGVEIAHRGRTAPVGEIKLVSKEGNFEVRAGSGMLLRINAQ